jgi:hypothetical protein
MASLAAASAPMADPAMSGLELLWLRIGRRVRRMGREWQARRRDRAGAGVAADVFAARCGLPTGTAPPPREDRCLPGPVVWPSVPSASRDVSLGASASLRRHAFDVLGTGEQSFAAAPTEAWQRRFSALTREFAPEAVRDYRPIDWHRDVASGYRWNPDDYYLDVRIAPVPGAEIKIPRELSRFQHLPVFGCSDRGEDHVEAILQMLDWIASNPVRRGVNWASTMDVAIRAVNWIWALRFFEERLASLPHVAWSIARSLYEHALHIEANLEYYREGTSNHYLANVAGLLYIGCAYPEFPDADRWVAFALQELVSEMQRQVYDDGADFEASTHYHRLVAETFVSCAALAERLPSRRRARIQNCPPSRGPGPGLRPLRASGVTLTPDGPVLPPLFYERLAAMGHFTAALTKSNGRVPQFGDNDSGRLHKLTPGSSDPRDHRSLLAAIGTLLGDEHLTAAGAGYDFEATLIAGGIAPLAMPGRPRHWFDRAGIAVLRRDRVYLAVTCGPNGQHGRGGHGHNDKLSFELHVNGCDVVVDGGCPAYTSAPAERNRFRATAAHNVVCLEDVEQDPIPAGLEGLFRLPERAARRLDEPSEDAISGFVNGPGWRHHRTWRLSDHELLIEDHVEATSPAWIGWNLDPGVACTIQARTSDSCAAMLHTDGLVIELVMVGATDPRLEDGTFSPGYGVRLSNRRLVARLNGATCQTRLRWTS